MAAVQLLEGERSDAKVRQRCERRLRPRCAARSRRTGWDAFPLHDGRARPGIAPRPGPDGGRADPRQQRAAQWLPERREGAPGAAARARRACSATRYASGATSIVLHSSRDHEHRLEDKPPQERRIDVWRRRTARSRLALLFAYLMTRSATWDEATIRLLAPARRDRTRNSEAPRPDAGELRIEAEIAAVVGATRRHREARRRQRVSCPCAWRAFRSWIPFGSDSQRARRARTAGGAGGRGKAVESGEGKESPRAESPAPAARACRRRGFYVRVVFRPRARGSRTRGSCEARMDEGGSLV